MSHKPKSIMLIDDDESMNFIHEIILEEVGFNGQIIQFETGQEALTHLVRRQKSGKPFPELIFLDINMAGMNGWDFLDEYRKFIKSQIVPVCLVVLTSSLNPDDEYKALSRKEVNAFRKKPLKLDMLEELFEEFFAVKQKSI